MQFIHPCKKRITNEIINIKNTMPFYEISELNDNYINNSNEMNNLIIVSSV